MKSKFITGLLLLFTLLSTNFTCADLFNFPKKSLLRDHQQEEVRKFFMDTMLEASKAFIAYLQEPIFYKAIKSSLNDPESLKKVLLERFFKCSRKKEDKKLISKYSYESTKHEADFSVIVKDGNDGLFNGIIRETIRLYADEHLIYEENKKEILKEIFKVLWEGITNKELTCSIDAGFINAIQGTVGGTASFDIVNSACDIFHKAPGDLCDKIAAVIAYLLCEEFNNTVDDNCCCTCLKGTFGVTKKIVKQLLPLVPTLIQIALLIVQEVI